MVSGKRAVILKICHKMENMQIPNSWYKRLGNLETYIFPFGEYWYLQLMTSPDDCVIPVFVIFPSIDVNMVWHK